MENKLFIDDRRSLDKVSLSKDGNYMFFLQDGKIILYQNQTLTEVYIFALEKNITGHYLLPEAVKKYNYIFRYIHEGQMKFILSVYYRGYYNAKPGGDDDRYIEETGYYNLTDKCVVRFDLPAMLIDSMNFQKGYKKFLESHTSRALENQKLLILETKIAYPETQNFSDDEVLSFLDSITPNV